MLIKVPEKVLLGWIISDYAQKTYGIYPLGRQRSSLQLPLLMQSRANCKFISRNQEAGIKKLSFLPLDDAYKLEDGPSNAFVGKYHVFWTILAKRKAAKRSRQMVTTSLLPLKSYRCVIMLHVQPSVWEIENTAFSFQLLQLKESWPRGLES